MADYTAEYFIDNLKMQPHPEGGWFYENLYGSKTLADYGGTDGHHYEGKERLLWNSILFLLKQGEVSHLHRLQSDETWFYHAGRALTVYAISPEGTLTLSKLGPNLTAGEQLQVLVPAGSVFGAKMEEGDFSLVGCVCCPNFRYEEFELLSREELLKAFPEHEGIICALTE